MLKTIVPLVCVALLLGIPQPLHAEGGVVVTPEDTPEETLDSLLALLRHNDPGTRLVAVRKLGRLKDAGAVEPLITALGDPDAWVREESARTLGVFGDERALKPLITALADASVPLRVAAAEGLGVLGHPDGVDPLVAALRGGEAVQKPVIDALVRIGEPAAAAVVKALGSDDPEVPPAAAIALGRIGGKLALEPLLQLLEKGDRRARCAAAEGLGALGDRKAVPPLRLALKTKVSGPAWQPIRYDVRVSAAKALGRIGDPAAIPDLQVATRDSRKTLSGAAKSAIAEIERRVKEEEERKKREEQEKGEGESGEAG
jgi:HEAT repeat protein